METPEITARIDKSTPLTRDDFPHEITGETASGPIYRVKQQWYEADAAEYWSKEFNSPAAQAVFRNEILNPPKTVGALQYSYVTAVHARTGFLQQLDTLIAGLQEINAEMNNYAEHNNLCSEYEEKLGIFNEMLRKAGYTGWFQFEGRERTYDVLVERTRTITERTWIQVTLTGSGNANDHQEAAYERACSEAEEVDDSVWEETDTFYDNYEVIECEEA